MSTRAKSRGITFIGFIILLLVIGFFAYLAMRLVPMYVEYMGVVKAMEQVRSEPGANNRSPEEIRRSLSLKFDTQYVDSNAVPPQAIRVIREGNSQSLNINYERRVPFIHNIELLATFDKTVDLSGVDN
jgi:Tfp pilus assembly major pilin PilA